MRKQILIFCHGYATQFVAINQQYSRLFSPDQYEVTIAYLTGKEDETIRQRHAPHHVLFLDSNKHSVRGLKLDAMKKIFTFCRRKKIAMVICHRYKPTYIMLWLSRLIGNPIIISVMHELNTLTSRTRKLTIALLAQDNFILAGVSNAVRDDLRYSAWRIPSERIITLYNSIDLATVETQLYSKQEARKLLNLPQHAFVFGNIGRLVKNKDQTTLLQAYANIHHQCPNSVLMILGSGPLENQLKQLADSLMIRDKVIFPGFVANASHLMKAFDVFVSSSTQEAFGMVLIEAMIAKVPVIATAVHGVPEVIQSSGILVSPSHPLGLANEMLKAYQMQSEIRCAWGEKGHTHTKLNFSTESFKKSFWHYFPELRFAASKLLLPKR